MLIKIIAVLAVLIETLLCLFTDILSGWSDFWIPIVLFLGLTVGIFVVYLLVLAVISLFVRQNGSCDKPEKFFIANINLVMELVLWFLRVKVNYNGFEKVPTDCKFLLVSNHRSMIDAFVLVNMMRNFSVSFISKPENFKLRRGFSVFLVLRDWRENHTPPTRWERWYDVTKRVRRSLFSTRGYSAVESIPPQSHAHSVPATHYQDD